MHFWRIFAVSFISIFLYILATNTVFKKKNDAAPVVRGRWIEEKKQTLIPVEFDEAGEPILHDYVIYRCDQCGRTAGKKEPYCHCGAKMDKEREG